MAFQTSYDPTEKIWSGPKYPQDDPTVSFVQLLLDRLALHGNKLVQLNHDTGYEMSANEMRLKCIRIAASLAALGIGAGDNVQIILNEHDDLVPLWLGIIAAGAGMNALHVSFNEQEMTHFIGLVEPKMIICEENLVPVIRKGLQNNNAIDATTVYTFAKSSQFKSVEDLLYGWDDESFKYELPTIGDLNESLALILCSSGTTGLPKAIRISHAMAKYGMCKEWPCEEGTRLFSASSLYWISCFFTIVPTLMQRLVRVITAEPKLTPDFCLQLVERRQINMFFTGTSNVGQIAECMRTVTYDLSRLGAFQTSGSHVSTKTRMLLREQFKGLTMYIYGLSDAGCCIAVSTNLKSTGQLAQGIRIKIVDMESGRQLGPNESGELWLKTPASLMGYIKISNVDAIVDGGWYRTGDVGYFDDDGELFLVDRQKDMIKYKGYQVAPSEVEQTIQRHCDVDGVVVVGIPDANADGMFLPAAVVVRSQGNATITEEDIIKCVEDNMMDCKRLRGGVYFVDKIPCTVTGKYQRNDMQKMAVKLFLANQNTV